MPGLSWRASSRDASSAIPFTCTFPHRAQSFLRPRPSVSPSPQERSLPHGRTGYASPDSRTTGTNQARPGRAMHLEIPTPQHPDGGPDERPCRFHRGRLRCVALHALHLTFSDGERPPARMEVGRTPRRSDRHSSPSFERVKVSYHLPRPARPRGAKSGPRPGHGQKTAGTAMPEAGRPAQQASRTRPGLVLTRAGAPPASLGGAGAPPHNGPGLCKATCRASRVSGIARAIAPHGWRHVRTGDGPGTHGTLSQSYSVQ